MPHVLQMLFKRLLNQVSSYIRTLNSKMNHRLSVGRCSVLVGVPTPVNLSRTSTSAKWFNVQSFNKTLIFLLACNDQLQLSRLNAAGLLQHDADSMCRTIVDDSCICSIHRRSDCQSLEHHWCAVWQQWSSCGIHGLFSQIIDIFLAARAQFASPYCNPS